MYLGGAPLCFIGVVGVQEINGVLTVGAVRVIGVIGVCRLCEGELGLVWIVLGANFGLWWCGWWCGGLVRESCFVLGALVERVEESFGVHEFV